MRPSPRPVDLPAPSRAACEMENLPWEFLSLWKNEEEALDQEENREEDDDADDELFLQELKDDLKLMEERSERLADLEELCNEKLLQEDPEVFPLSNKEECQEEATADQQEEATAEARQQQKRNHEEEERRVGWKRSEMNLLSHIWALVTDKHMNQHEELYVKELALLEAEKEGVDSYLIEDMILDKWHLVEDDKRIALINILRQSFVYPESVRALCPDLIPRVLDAKSLSYFRRNFSDYYKTRTLWIARNHGVALEDITCIRPMMYTSQPAPRYVYEGRSNSLQIYSVKIAGVEQWPLHVFGVVAIRDSVDSKRNVIFDRRRDCCQIITKENPYLVLTGPTRAVGMNEPVSIEAELKIKGRFESEDQYLIAQELKIKGLIAREGLIAQDMEVPFGLNTVELIGPLNRKLKIALGVLNTCVEATIFIQIIEGAWPVGFHGQFAARTTNIHKKIILVEFGSGDVTKSRIDGNMDHLRHVVSVEASGELIVLFKAWKCDEETMTEEVKFKAEMLGRSFSYLKVGSCNLRVLVAWSRIRPMCEELVPDRLDPKALRYSHVYYADESF